VERNRITTAILIDVQSGGFWGASPPQNPERLFYRISEKRINVGKYYLIDHKFYLFKQLKEGVRGIGASYYRDKMG